MKQKKHELREAKAKEQKVKVAKGMPEVKEKQAASVEAQVNMLLLTLTCCVRIKPSRKS